MKKFLLTSGALILPCVLLAQDSAWPKKFIPAPQALAPRRAEAAAAQVQKAFDGTQPVAATEAATPVDPYEDVPESVQERLNRSQEEQAKIRQEIETQNQENRSLEEKLAQEKKLAGQKMSEYDPDNMALLRRRDQLKAGLPYYEALAAGQESRRQGLIAGAVLSGLLGAGSTATGVAFGVLGIGAPWLSTVLIAFGMAGLFLSAILGGTAGRAKADVEEGEKFVLDRKQEIFDTEWKLHLTD